MIFRLFLIFWLGGFFWLSAQPTQNPQQKPRKIFNRNAEKIQRIPEMYGENLLLSGNVILEHNGAVLKADSVLLDELRNMFIAFSNVKLDQEDKHLTSDSLNYNGNTSIGIAFGNVILRDAEQTLYTNKLTYNRNTNKAYYDTGGTIVSKDNTISSRVGVYDLTTKSNSFDGDVNITNDEYIITGRDIKYFSQGDYMTFNDQTIIRSRTDPNDFIVTEKGRYFLGKKEAILETRSSVHSNGRIIWADYMRFFQNTGYGEAIGDVLIEDPAEKRFIKGEYGEVFQNQDSAYVTQNALAVKAFETDSLYLHADTLVATKRNEKSMIRAYYGAKFFKSNIQGKADSIAYEETDGLLKFYRDPIVWSGYRQITGDTIFVYSNTIRETVDSISVFQNAFAISKTDSLTETDFNQLKSRRMLGIFTNEQLDWVQGEGNAQSLVYMEEEDEKTKVKELVGINTSNCGIIEADFELREVNVISCRINADSEFFPPSKMPDELRKLPDFDWREDEQFTRWQDIMIAGNVVETQTIDEINSNEIPNDSIEMPEVENVIKENQDSINIRQKEMIKLDSATTN